MATPPRNVLREAWRVLSRLPGGRRLFSRIVGRMAPYTSSIRATIVELRPGYAQVEIEEEPDGSEELEHFERQLAAVSLRYAVSRQWSVRLEVAVPFRPKGSTDETAIAAMIAFVF